MRVDGRGVRRIPGGQFGERPAWSADGKWIAFQSTSGIELARPDGSGRHSVRTTSFASYPAWSPDSRHLTFAQSG
jgi:Tol biopolymer transport system component